MVGGSEKPSQDTGTQSGRDVVRTISHNLRTPLAVIKGCTDMLLSHDLDDQRRRELLLTAATNVDRLAEAVAWLEDNFEDLAGETTIRLPEAGEEEGSV